MAGIAQLSEGLGIKSGARRAGSWLAAHPGVLCLLWALWLAAPYLCLGPHSYVRIHDNADSFLSEWIGLRDALRNGQLGYWMPQSLAGIDRLAEQTIFLYAVPFALLPGWLAYGLVMLGQRFLASYFLFRFTREDLGAGYLPAIFAATSYSLFNQPGLEAWDGWTLVDGVAWAGIPFILWWFSRFAEGGRLRFFPALGLGILFGLGSSFPLGMFGLLGFAWFTYFSPRRGRALWIEVGLFVAGWMLASLPTLIPAYLNASMAQRATWAPHFSGEVLRRAITTAEIFRDNLLSLAISVVTLFSARGKLPRLAGVLGFAAACVVSNLAWYFVKGIAGARLGALGSFQFDRTAYLAPLFFLLAAVIGLEILDHWRVELSGPSGRWQWPFGKVVATVVIAIVALQSLVVAVWSYRETSLGSSYAALYRQPDLMKLAATSDESPPLRVVTVGDHPAYAWAYGLETADGYWSLAPRQYHDFFMQVLGPLLVRDQWRRQYVAEYGLRLEMFSPTDGFPKGATVRFADYYNLPLLSLANVGYVISAVPLDDANLKPVASPNLEARARWQRMQRHEKYWRYLTGQYPGEARYVYENRAVMPRAFAVTSVKAYPSAAAVLRAMAAATAENLRAVAYVESSVESRLPTQTARASVIFRQYSADRMVLDVEASGAALIVVTNEYSPYWQAEVDGAPADIFLTDATFQSVAVSSGQHSIVLRYRPPY